MFGLIGSLQSAPGKRDELLAILTRSTGEMPGCLSYVVAKDPDDADLIWITEVWTDADAHKASLSLPSVQAAIAEARPLFGAMGMRVVTEPVSWYGLPSRVG